jgi:GalNAc-alpha-(1->4)-GalNAc-alpha-(1->3)-diNAcBac-PP-undecaprenol alpha-1,4-N-acetyl-D-galactosaminyltransferase
MKIAIVNCQLGGGGAERVMANLANFFVGEGHSVVFFLTSAEYKGYEFFLHPEVRVDRFVGQTAKNPLEKIRLLKKQIKAYRPDVIIGVNQISSFYASIVGSRLHIKVITSERNSPKDYPTSKIERLLRNYAYSRSSRVVFQTAGAMACFSQKIQRKGVVIPNPLDSSFCPLERKLESINERQIVMIGRLDCQKNQVVALRAFQKLSLSHPECVLDIYGWALDKKYDAVIRNELSANKACNIHFCGPTEKVLEVLSKSGIYLMTSDYEGMPNSLMEALACGVPTVSTDCRPGGARDLLQGDDGAILVPIGDVDEITKALKKIIENYGQYFYQANKNADAIMIKYQINTIGMKWLDLIHELIQGLLPNTKG